MSPLQASRIQNTSDEQRTIHGENLREIARSFLISRKIEGIVDGTLHTYTHKVRIFIDWCDAQQAVNIEQITKELLRTFFLYTGESHNPGGVLAIYKVVRALFRWYEEESGYPTPMHGVKPPRVRLPPLAPASMDDIHKVLSFCDIRDTAIVLILLDTGMRAAELLALRVEDVNLLAGTIVIRHGKGNKQRVAFIGKRTRKALRSYITQYGVTDEIFGFTYTGLRMMLQRRCRDAGVPYISPHAFRRTFALEMLRNGADVMSLQLLMGHADLQVLRRYLAQTNDDLRIAHGRASPADRL